MKGKERKGKERKGKERKGRSMGDGRNARRQKGRREIMK